MDRQGAELTESTACMPKTHSVYDAAFRQGAVDLLLSSGRPLKRVAADLGMSANSLRTWRSLPTRPPRFAACNAKTNTCAASAKS